MIGISKLRSLKVGNFSLILPDTPARKYEKALSHVDSSAEIFGANHALQQQLGRGGETFWTGPFRRLMSYCEDASGEIVQHDSFALLKALSPCLLDPVLFSS